MQFVSNGPDVPDRLIHQHELGDTVFFCGAGISRTAGLPDFKLLTSQLYTALGKSMSPTQETAFKNKQYDTAIGLLEDDYPPGSITMRSRMVDLLSPTIKHKNLQTHRALARLSITRNNQCRIVTTNFDRLFQQAFKLEKISTYSHNAPMLPAAKRNWNGLVYLHGRQPKSNDNEAKLKRLVVTSADFGMAYLTERWAARFVTDLFRNFTVCFVGYSVEDAVLRYMMDALAADRSRGENTSEVFAFASFEAGTKEDIKKEWEAKKITPILYSEESYHQALHKTLHQWGKIYKEGTQGKSRLIAESATTLPLASTVEDDFVGRVLWALGDSTGLAAKNFSELKPVPSLDWLTPLTENRFSASDLSRFNILHSSHAPKISFSILERPSPCESSPWMGLMTNSDEHLHIDKILSHLANWLACHINDPKLILWVAKRGGQMHPVLQRCLSSAITNILKLESDKSKLELDRIQANAPNAIPDKYMRLLWECCLVGKLYRYEGRLNFYSILEQLNVKGLTTPIRSVLKTALSPRIELRATSLLAAKSVSSTRSKVSDIVEWDVRLAGEYPQALFEAILSKKCKPLTESLHLLIDVFSSALEESLELIAYLGKNSHATDLILMHQPAIALHDQNRHYKEWTYLIEFTREAWLVLAKLDAQRARLVAEQWWRSPHDLLRRLALFAAANSSVIPSDQALEWLLDE